jgi:hypothetical protein
VGPIASMDSEAGRKTFGSYKIAYIFLVFYHTKFYMLISLPIIIKIKSKGRFIFDMVIM